MESARGRSTQLRAQARGGSQVLLGTCPFLPQGAEALLKEGTRSVGGSHSQVILICAWPLKTWSGSVRSDCGLDRRRGWVVKGRIGGQGSLGFCVSFLSLRLEGYRNILQVDSKIRIIQFLFFCLPSCMEKENVFFLSCLSPPIPSSSFSLSLIVSCFVI